MLNLTVKEWVYGWRYHNFFQNDQNPRQFPLSPPSVPIVLRFPLSYVIVSVSCARRLVRRLFVESFVGSSLTPSSVPH